jgi:hypothetical protein
MRTTTIFALACLTVSQAAFAQVYTTPAGYVSKSLSQGFNAIGLTVQNASLSTGQFETINATTLIDSQLAVTPTAGRTYILEFVSGAAIGAIFEVPAANISGTTITITTVPATDLTTLGLTTSDRYNLRLAPTLEEIFTTTSLSSGGILQAGISSTGADVVWVPTGPGAYNQYFLHTTAQFRIAGTSTAASNVPVIYADGILVQKKGTAAASLTISGEIKTVGTTTTIGQGLNLVTVVAPAGANLGNAGIEDDIQAGISATGADIVWIQQANLSYKKYFRHTTNNWRDVDAPTVNMTAPEVDAVTISGAIFIQKKTTGIAQLDMQVPSSYSGL